MGRDSAEVAALKRTRELELPVFVIVTSSASPEAREVRLGWVSEWDDPGEVFLILFSERRPESAVLVSEDDQPFSLTASEEERRALRKVRPSQSRFSFEVRRRYGTSCAVCEISEPELLEAAHLCAKSRNGADDARNGLLLCVLHHRAFDRAFWAIDPLTKAIRVRQGGPSSRELGITRDSLCHLPRLPHQAALEHAWTEALAKHRGFDPLR